MAAAPVVLAEEAQNRIHINFYKISRLLIDLGTKVFRELFDSIIPPTNLANKLMTSKAKLQQLKTKRILTQPQWGLLYPPSGTVAESKSFDITLLFKLLREICGLTAPATGWDKLPSTTDITLEADLARIKYYRNEIYGHVTKMELNDDDFKRIWEVVKNALVRIVKCYDSRKAAEFEREIDKIHRHLVTKADVEELVEELTKLALDNKEEIEKLRTAYAYPAELNVNCLIKLASTGAWLVGSAYILHRYRDDPENFLRMVHGFVLPTGVLVYLIAKGSIKIYMQAKTSSGLEEFWIRYQTGQLREDLEKVLITEELKQLANGEAVELEVTVSEEEYENALHHLLSLEKELKQESKAKGKGKGKRSVSQKDPKTDVKEKAGKVPERPSISPEVAERDEEIRELGKNNFIRLSRLLCVGITILRELFDSKFPPKELASKLRQQRVYRILSRMRGTQLTDSQWDMLFPDSRSCLVESKSFDMDLLFKLLEEICDISPPAPAGWNYQPDPNDDSLGAQLARIKWYQFCICSYVNKYQQLGDKTFQSYWRKIKDALLKLVRHYDVTKVKVYGIVIDNLYSASVLGYPDIIVHCALKLVWLKAVMGMSYVIKGMLMKPQNIMKLEEVFPKGLVVVDIIKGSIKIVLWATELNALEEFWKRYRTGKLKKDLRKVMVTEEVKKMTTGGKVEMTISLNEQDYEAARENLLSFTAFEPQGFTQEEGLEFEQPEEYATTEQKDPTPEHPSQLRKPKIEILHGEPLEDRTSIFQAHLAVITSPRQVRTVLTELKIQKQEVAAAAFVVWAYRISNDVKKFYAESDVGSYEYFAGRRVFNLLQETDAKNVMVIVTCWQGDVPALGIDTYDNISKCSRKLVQSFLSALKKPGDITSKLVGRGSDKK